MRTKSLSWITALIVVAALAAAALYLLNRPSDPDPLDVIDIQDVSFRDGAVIVALRCDLGRFALGAREKTEPDSRAERFMLHVGLAPVEVQPELNTGLDPETVILETDILSGWGFHPNQIVTEYSVRRSFQAPLEGVEVFSVPLTVPLLKSRYVAGTYNTVAEAVFQARHVERPSRSLYMSTVGREVVPVTVPDRETDEGVGWKREELAVQKAAGASMEIGGAATLEIPPNAFEEDGHFTLDVLFHRHALTLLYGSAVEGRHECARRAYSGGQPLSLPATLRISYAQLGDWEELSLLDPFEQIRNQPSIRERARVDRSTKTVTVSLRSSGGIVQLIRNLP